MSNEDVARDIMGAAPTESVVHAAERVVSERDAERRRATELTANINRLCEQADSNANELEHLSEKEYDAYRLLRRIRATVGNWIKVGSVDADDWSKLEKSIARWNGDVHEDAMKNALQGGAFGTSRRRR